MTIQRKKILRVLLILFLIGLPILAFGQNPLPQITFGVEETGAPSDFVLTMQIVFLITILSLAPSLLIMMTSFTRMTIVFHFLRSALATQTVPSNQILIGLALFTTLFIMKPVITEINESALQPYLKEEITQRDALTMAAKPIKAFMLKQTREKDLALFLDLSQAAKPTSKEEISLLTLIPAFIISELKTAFQIGFLLYLPMLAIDMIVSSVLLSMGMMMLPPIMISMPFKILLFVLVDGWYLVIESIVKGYV
ncbi:flagellar type III secretion system pore protein FliP [Caldithrix abyssi]|nr:flagellar type III secretion system pore protein FliP [Caldithrix abyssi]